MLEWHFLHARYYDYTVATRSPGSRLLKWRWVWRGKASMTVRQTVEGGGPLADALLLAPRFRLFIRDVN